MLYLHYHKNLDVEVVLRVRKCTHMAVSLDIQTSRSKWRDVRQEGGVRRRLRQLSVPLNCSVGMRQDVTRVDASRSFRWTLVNIRQVRRCLQTWSWDHYLCKSYTIRVVWCNFVYHVGYVIAMHWSLGSWSVYITWASLTVSQRGPHKEPPMEIKIVSDSKDKRLNLVMQDLIVRICGRYSLELRGHYSIFFGRRN